MLAAKGVAFEAHQLPEEKLTALDAASYLGAAPAQVFKSIVVIRADGGKPLLALVPAPSQVDLKALGRIFSAGKLKAASQPQAEALTGLQTGGISPLALIDQGFQVVLDASALGFDTIYLSAGQRGLNLSLSPTDLLALTKAKAMPIAK